MSSGSTKFLTLPSRAFSRPGRGTMPVLSRLPSTSADNRAQYQCKYCQCHVRMFPQARNNILPPTEISDAEPPEAVVQLVDHAVYGEGDGVAVNIRVHDHVGAVLIACKMFVHSMYYILSRKCNYINILTSETVLPRPQHPGGDLQLTSRPPHSGQVHLHHAGEGVEAEH